MDYEITIGGATRKVTLSHLSGEGERYEFGDPVAGTSTSLTILRREPSRLLVSVADKTYSVRPVSQAPGRIAFLMNGDPVVAELATRKASRTTASGVVSVGDLVVANFPARVVRLPVSKGSRVKSGETLLVLEAMKMESYVEAPQDCTVLEAFVKEGEMVARGARLFRLEIAS